MFKEFQDAYEREVVRRKRFNIFSFVIMGVIISITLVSVTQYKQSFSSSKKFSTSSTEKTEQTRIPVTIPEIKIETNAGSVLVELHFEYTPAIVNKLIELSKSDYYNNDKVAMESMAPFSFAFTKVGTSAKEFVIKNQENKCKNVVESLIISKISNSNFNNLIIDFQPHDKIHFKVINV